MKNSEHYMLRIMRNVVILIFIESMIFLVIGKDAAQNIYGLLLGAIANILFFRLMYLNINRILEKQMKQASTYIFLNYMARYFITGMILFIAARNDNINLFSCFLGLLSIKIVMYIENFYNIYIDKKKKK